MALQDGIVGARHTGQRITWLGTDKQPHDLTGVTGIAGKLKDKATGTVRAIAGTLTPITPLTSGVFTWAYADADLVVGKYTVEFTATYNDGLADKTFIEAWQVRAALS